MTIEFRGSPAFTLGVEIEVLLVDPGSRQLLQKSRPFLERCRQRKIPHVKAEIHQSMLEIDTAVAKTVEQCFQEVRGRLVQLDAVAKELGMALALAGSHPFAHWSSSSVFPTPRYEAVTEKFRWLAQRMTVYGTHVHVGVPDGAAAIAVMNGAIPYLPLLVALAGNSPFWQGIDTGLNSCRLGVMDVFPFSGLQKQFPHWDAFVEYCEALISGRAITSLKDLYWHVRPNAQFGTIEFRLCDAMTTCEETFAIVAFIQALVVHLIKQGPKQQLFAPDTYWMAPFNIWIAARDGLEGYITTHGSSTPTKIADLVLAAVEELQPTANSLGCSSELDYIRQIVASGNGAQRQRAVYNAHGTIEAVVDYLLATPAKVKHPLH